MAQIDYSKFQMSLKRLIEQYENHVYPRPFREKLEVEGVAESVIQRFKTCYDCLWKVLKRYLSEVLGVPDIPNSPKPIFRFAAENSLFDMPVEQWFEFAQARVETSHDYDGVKAQACLSLVGDFIEGAKGLYGSMTGETWV